VRHIYECSVRFDDLDAFGHVNNVTFAAYLQEARIDWAHARAAGTAMTTSVVVYQAIDYLRPVPFRTEPVTVAVWVTRVGGSSYDIAGEVVDGDTVFARATTTLVAYDLSARAARPLSDGERTALERFLEP
jgi:acyl-CoA thioester hydrolase